MDRIKLAGKIVASSIIEVVIAMIVILIIFTMAMMISANVMRSSMSAKKLQAISILHDVMVAAERNKDNESKDLTVEGFQIKQEIKKYHDDPNLTEVHLTAYDANNNNVAELQKVIIN